ncbi:MAG: FtsX-like permease family protein [Cyclobacteriaceae bacterium]
MLNHQIKFLLRSLLKKKSFALISILGLAVAFACILLIASYVRLEFSYDQFHEHKNDTYRVVNTITDEDTGEISDVAYTYAPLAPLIGANIEEASAITRIHEKQALMWVDGSDKFIEKNFLYADSAFFEIFTWESVYGNLEEALKVPFSLVITESLANKYFQNENPVGKTINHRDDNGTHKMHVRAVVKDLPGNSHLEADLICSMATLRSTQPWNFYWFYPPMYTYIKFDGAADVESVKTRITDLVKTNGPEGHRLVDYELQQLDQIHLHSQREGEFRATGNYSIVVIFIIIGAFILVIAVVNFINLATARSIEKSKEVGIKKVMGASRKTLIGQFITESVFTILIAFALSILIALLAKTYFENIIDKPLQFGFILDGLNPLVVLGMVLIIGLLAGIYPAIFISSFKPLSVVKKTVSGVRGLTLRKVLVVFQFTISSALILGTIVIYQQMMYLQDKQLGFDKEQVIVIPLEETADQNRFELLKEMIAPHSGVIATAMTSGVPGTDGFYGFGYQIGTDETTNSLQTLGTDWDFVETYKTEIIQGRGFDREITSDFDNSFIINEAAAKFLGWEEPIGEELTLNYYISGPINKKGQVIGVVKDFHFESLYQKVDPLVIHLMPASYYCQYVSVRVHPGQLTSTIDHLSGVWSTFNPDRPFDFFFLDDSLQKIYQSEQNLSKLMSVFATLAIIISSLGLLGLAAFSVQQRIKEIGIRKVLGASEISIFGMISKQYLWMIIIANLIAWPSALMFINEWLNNFAFRISINADVFIYALLAAMVVVFLSIGAILLRAVRSNAVETLRYE